MAKRIFYVTPQQGIKGGIKVAYQHVAALRRHGFDAAIIHKTAQAPTWFSIPGVPVLAGSECRSDAEDVLVFGEDVPDTLRTLASCSARKVVLNQNHFNTPVGLGNALDYREFGVAAVITTGDVITNYIARRFPGIPVATVHLTIDPTMFHPLDKVMRIAVVPRKRRLEFQYIQDLLRAQHPKWKALDWAVLEGANEDLVARVLGRSAIFLSLARFEGVGLTALEAMSCGCAVAGFDGIGGREYATSENGFWAAEDDLDGAVQQLATCLQSVAEGTATSRIANGQATARAYTITRMESELVAFWRNFLR